MKFTICIICKPLIMITMKNVLRFAFLFLVSATMFTSCSKDDDGLSVKGTAQFEITDAPIDDASIQGAFVTVTAVKVDGETISNFSGKQTIDLMAYQNGNTKALGLAELDAGTYSNIALVLDYEQDVDGNSPGCYILTDDGTRHSLGNNTNASNEIVISNKDFTVEEDGATKVVLDFDLRKSVTYESQSSSSDKYEFVTQSELRAAVRVVAEAETGQVSGNCQDNLDLADRIVVYAYAKGTYNKDTEMSGQGASNITFKNAVTSAVIDAQGNYTLAFLEEGDYELHFFAYEQPADESKPSELRGELSIELLTSLGLDLNSIRVDANAAISINVLATAIIP